MKKVIIQMIKENPYSDKERFGSYIIRIDKYISNDVIITKTSYRNIKTEEGYKKIDESKGEQNYQKIIKFFKKEGYQIL